MYKRQVVPFRNGIFLSIAAGEEGCFQMGGDGGTVNHAVFYAQTGGLPGSAFQLSFRVVGGIVKAEGHPDAVVPVQIKLSLWLTV